MLEAETVTPDIFALEGETEEDGWVDGEPTDTDLEEEEDVADIEELEEENSY